MPEKKTERHVAPRREIKLSVKIALAAVVLLLVVLAGFRVAHWTSQREDARVLVLVNPWNDVKASSFKPRLKTVEGVQVDRSCVGDLEEMLADCRTAGVTVTVTAGYRTADEQLRMFQNEVDRQMRSGVNADRAYAMAEQRMGNAGTSEHELGLAIDVQGAAAQSWLRDNAWRYGFILRYPEGSESITGRSADSGHFRYVGRSAAEQIYSLNITLEEYMGMFFTQDAEIVLDK
jgi:D-alanyl-D-alanine carboxypeptidase